jgi:uncharacterized protein (TIGR02145 family)
MKKEEITIGDQVWMAENLSVDTFRNGDPIPEAKTYKEWVKAGENEQPAWCYYDNDPKNGEEYGKLYNWYAVIDPRGLAPIGWNVPSDDDWKTLTEYLGGEVVAGTKMKSTIGWVDDEGQPVIICPITNESGFNGLPGGTRNSFGTFNNVGSYGGFWSSSESSSAIAWNRYLLNGNHDLVRDTYYKRLGFSVRCLRD